MVLSLTQGFCSLGVSLMALLEQGHIDLLAQIVAVLNSQPVLGLGRAKRRAGRGECGGGLFAATSSSRKSGSRLLGFGFERSQGRVGAGESVDQLLAPLLVTGGAVSVRLGSVVDSRQALNLR